MTELVETLRSLGKESTAKIYRRHGAAGEVFGVSYADLGKLQKKYRGDHALAQRLWKSGVHDARILATQIADGAKATRKELEAWLAGVEGHPLVDAFAVYVSRTPFAKDCMQAWMASPEEWRASAGWRLLTAAAQEDGVAPPGGFEPFLTIIEREVHGAPNRVRYSMNNALIAIGCRGGALEVKALKVAKAIGRVEVDHGETDCQTPDAAAYIAKVRAHQAKKKARA